MLEYSNNTYILLYVVHHKLLFYIYSICSVIGNVALCNKNLAQLILSDNHFE